MREIRVRAWFPIAKRMIHFEGIRFCSEYDSLCLGIRESDCTETYQHLAGKSYIPDEMGVTSWSTGLKDKNGVEIYEGDIILLYRSIKIPREVYWEEDGCQCRLASRGDRQFDKTSILAFAKTGEVIGNIWENPELLGEKP